MYGGNQAWSRVSFLCMSRNHSAEHRIRRYGLTQDEFDELLYLQGMACAICRTLKPRANGWHVDHSHSTGLIRGILCSHCNIGLGNFQDSADLLENAIDYLIDNQVLERKISIDRKNKTNPTYEFKSTTKRPIFELAA